MSQFKIFGNAFAQEVPGAEVRTAQGGVAHRIAPETAFDRFLIMGTGSTFYANESKVTTEALADAQAYIADSPDAAMQRVEDVLRNRLAYKRDPAIMALAMLTLPSVPLQVRRRAAEGVGTLVGTGTDLLHFVAFRHQISGGKWNAIARRAVANWFNEPSRNLELQVAKYDQRDKWSMRDALRLAHPEALDPERATLFDWAAHPDKRMGMDVRGFPLLQAWQELRSGDPERAAELVLGSRVPREVVPGELLARDDVWAALAHGMPGNALLRNLGKMGSMGLLDDHAMQDSIVQRIYKAAERLHPVAFLIAWKQYGAGMGLRGSNKWEVEPRVLNALEQAYTAAFGTLQVYDGRPLVAMDVSGSMTYSATGNIPLSPLEMEVCLVDVLRHQFPNARFIAFASPDGRQRWTLRASGESLSGGYVELAGIKQAEGRVGIARLIEQWQGAFMGTDCSIPPRIALEDASIDSVVTITDSETGYDNPSKYVAQVQETRPDFRAAVVALAANRLSIADPADPNQMDIVGASADVPQVLAQFLAGKL